MAFLFVALGFGAIVAVLVVPQMNLGGGTTENWLMSVGAEPLVGLSDRKVVARYHDETSKRIVSVAVDGRETGWFDGRKRSDHVPNAY